MKRIPSYAFVYFSTGQWSDRRIGLRRRLRIARRFKRRTYFWFLAWLVRFLTRSELAHVSIGYDGAVLHPGIVDNEYWPQIAYTLKYPTLVCVFAVPLKRPIDLDIYPHGRKRVWPTLRRWALRGRGPVTQDCTCIAIDCLRRGGVDVPLTLVSPQALHDWLKENGYERTTLGPGRVPPDHHGPDRVAGGGDTEARDHPQGER